MSSNSISTNPLAPDAHERLNKVLKQKTEWIDAYCADYLETWKSDHPGLRDLMKSVRYSSLSGGKRFRPLLSILTAEALGQPAGAVLPYALAVEFIHTYSLIHDDLPCMDNDDMRRGQPTNHKVFGEAMALLAGDALLTEAFQILSDRYAESPEAALAAMRELSSAAGANGMIGGQAIDISVENQTLELELLQKIHELKTGALIRAAVVGAGHICFATERQMDDLKTFGARLGLAFQVADDILDADEGDSANYVHHFGLEKTRDFLNQVSGEALNAIQNWDLRAKPLRDLVMYNQSRSQ